jgi:hypothetical protein
MGECPKTGIHHFEDLGFMTPCAILGGSRRLHDLFDLAAGAVDCLAEVVQYIGVQADGDHPPRFPLLKP